MVPWQLKMQTSDFAPYFDKESIISKHFLGVFSFDQIPKKIPKKSFFVLNLDPSYLKGSHWIAVSRLVTTEIEIFDSLAKDISNLLPAFKHLKTVDIVHNTDPVQSPHSKLCGKFVVTFLIERMLNQDFEMQELINTIFSNNLEYNDIIVTEFCKKWLQ